MNPSPTKTPVELAEEFEVAAKIAHENANPVFGMELAQHAHYLRMQSEQEQKNETH